MFFFQGFPSQPFIPPTSFPGTYSEDDFVNDMAQSRALRGYGFGYHHGQGHHGYYHHPHHRRRHPGGFHRGPFAPASWDNLWYGFNPACAASHPSRHGPAHSPEEFPYNVWQQDGHQHAHDRLEAITRHRALAREREAQRQRALAEAAAREQQARAAREEHIRAACAARTQARQARAEEVLLALLGQLGLAVDPAQASPVTPEVNGQRSANSATAAAPPSVPSPMPADRKGKGKAVDVPVEVTAPIPASVPAETPTLTLKEELEARIRSETDPDVQASLVLLYSDVFDIREPTQPVAGPSGHKHFAFQVPISGPSSSSAYVSASPVPVSVQSEEPTIDSTADALSTTTDAIANTAEGDHSDATARIHSTVTSPLPSLVQIKDVEDALRKLEGAFEFPAQLDFLSDRPRSPSPSPAHPRSEAETETGSLAYTANNTPVRAYEHALNALLAKLDAVESNGDVEVRGRRKAIVKEVERALEAMDRRIEESRERSRERARRGRRGSVSSESRVSEAEVTVTPYNVHNSDRVDEVEVAVAAEEGKVEVEEDVVEASVEGEDAAKSFSDVEDSVIAEDTARQVEVNEHVPIATKANPESNAAPSHVDIAEPKIFQRAVGISDSGAEPNSPLPPLNPSIHGEPSLPLDDAEGLGSAFNVLSLSDDAMAPHIIPPAIDGSAAPSHDSDSGVPEQENVSGALPSELQTAPEPAENPASSSTLSAIVPPQDVACIESSATDATFVAAESDSELVTLSALHDATFNTPMSFEPEPTQRSAPVTTPDSPASTSSGGEETFLLSSTPLADEDQSKRRWPSTSASTEDDGDFGELEIIGKEELEAARDDSDWSDVESASESDLEVV